jgi:DHA1 family bicyclomycin/chloramphenicol resistance-like MFS transporter/DHA1 family 2-module integral membrane pump EmrD-like MFS transporter
MLMAIVLMLACATQVSSDIYIPSLISMNQQLSGATFNLLQLSLAIFLFGVSLTQLIFGPLSEGIGRKPPLLIGLGTMSLGSVICAGSNNIEHLIIGRLIQGMGAGALSALWRTVFRDIMSGQELAKNGSFISVFMIFVVSVAPALGGYLEQFGWRSSFIFMLFYTTVSLIVLQFFYQETNQNHHIDKLKISYILETYKELYTSRLFMGMSICTLLSYGGLFSWIVLAPSLLMYRIGLSSVTFGWIMALTGALGYSVAALANAQLIKHIGIPKIMQMGWGIMIASGLMMLAGYSLFGVSPWGIIIPILLFYFGSTLIWPNAFATAFTPFGHIAGYAGSLYGFMQLVGGAIMGSLAAQLPETDQRVLAVIIIITSLTSLLIYRVWVIPPSKLLKSEKK